MPSTGPVPRDRATGLRTIALLETAKGLLALLAAAALAAVGPEALQQDVERLLGWLGVASQRGGTALLDRITPQTLHVAIAVALVYASMRLLEGWGLWRHRAWASWLGCIGAAAYLPFELYALWRHPDWLTWGVLLLNLAIVLVLANDLRRRHRASA
ncbi:DUF2127 domain-containing protein [Luteimonas sp. BDR2-5]|nr:DUF2127 domain-containing protein [Luteimonas sp. BDR2-5]MCD9029896.1 DUF2127 domain-containing protein [Luteimonas sp. BDR2-5]